MVRNAERIDVSADVSEEWIQASAAQLFLTRDTEIPLFDGRWLSLRTRLASDGSALVVVSDITSMKHSEERLKQVAQEMRGLAYTDSLTGIANRRVFDDVISKEFARTRRSRSHLSLLLLDIDHFKTYNDTYGHLEGDKCLKAIGDVLLQWLCDRPAWDRQGRRHAPRRGPALHIASACDTTQSKQQINRDGQHWSGEYVRWNDLRDPSRVGGSCGPSAL